MSQHQLDPFALLLDIERQMRLNARGLPEQMVVKNIYSGIGFRLGRDQLLAPMGEVTEILTYPTLTRVPRVKPWVRGLANIRGNLLPVLDLQGYLGGKMTVLTKKSRILGIHSQGVIAGLLVDEVFGMKHFFEENIIQKYVGFDESIKPYLTAAYDDGNQRWGVFSFNKLVAAAEFLQVAA